MIQEDLPANFNIGRIKVTLCVNDGILPFVEKPSRDEHLPNDAISEINILARIRATDLFSLFTADIIKEAVIFTR
jgi:hypothetical protein